MISKYIVSSACLLLAMAFSLSGQTVTITVKDDNRKALSGAAVRLTKVADSAKVYESTEKSGAASFEGIADALYIVNISYLGYETLEKTINIKAGHRTFDFQMKQAAITLGEVSVTALRPLIRQEDDKMIIDPMPLANTSTNTLEVLEKTPGLYVDQDGGIFLSTTSAAAVYINGRELKLSTQDIATLLRSLPPGSVQKIEVMRTPSTKYDAASSGGIINIVLKKGVKIGRFGSVNAGMNQGFYGNRFAGINFNNSSGKITSYLNTNYNHNDQRVETNTVRFLMQDTALRQLSVSRHKSEQGYIGYGLGYGITDDLNLSYDGRVNLSFPNSVTNRGNSITGAEDQELAAGNNRTESSSQFFSLQQDIGITRKFDTSGSELDTKLSYSYNDNSSSQDYLNEYSSPIVFQEKGDGQNLQKRHFCLVQSDLTYMFPHKIKLETGIKSTYQDYRSSADYQVDHNGTPENDPKRTNAFGYIENINAAYAQASRTFGKWFTLKAGLRMEHTYMNGHQTIPADTSFLISRVDLFPYVYLSRKIIKILGAQLDGYIIYRRTISRPDYQNLNPYIKYVDEFLYETGNPALKPQFTDNYEVNISYDDTPLFAVGQNYTHDIFSAVVYRDKTNENIAVNTYDNLGTNKETYFRLIIGLPPGKKYFFALGGQYNNNKYDGVYENLPLSYSRDSWRFFTFHSLTLFKNTRITLNGFIMLHGQRDFYELNNFGQLNMGITQSLFKKKLTITVNVRDIFGTMKTGFELNQGSISTYGDRYADSRRIGINIRYTFGIRKKDERNGIMHQEPEE